MPTNPACLLHGQFFWKVFLIFAWMKTYKQKRSRVSLWSLFLSMVEWTWNILVYCIVQESKTESWQTVMTDGSSSLADTLQISIFSLSLSHSVLTNICCVGMNSLGHKYIIRRQETGCENNLPASLLQHHVVAAEILLETLPSEVYS